MGKDVASVSPERIERLILMVRGQKVMLSTDLAELYEVEPRVLVQSVKRNLARFPDDFMFQLTEERVLKLEITNCDFKLGRPPLRQTLQKILESA
jgi:hypothetical protein